MKSLSRFILKLFGWKIIGTVAPVKKCLLLGAPHTSVLDFVVSFFFYKAVGGKAYCLVKAELFVFPLNYLLKAMGGIPIKRDTASGVVRQIITQFAKADTLHLAIAPEGTRKRTTRWKGGFYTIAKQANIPVYVGIFDWKRKEVGRFDEEFILSDSMENDIKRLKKIYKDYGVEGKHPENFTTD